MLKIIDRCLALIKDKLVEVDDFVQASGKPACPPLALNPETEQILVLLAALVVIVLCRLLWLRSGRSGPGSTASGRIS